MAGLLLLGGCGGGGNAPASDETKSASSPKEKPLNLIVLLDLSDRLLVKDQVQRDTAIIQQLWETFGKRQGNQLFINSQDRFRVVVAPQRAAQDPGKYADLIYAPKAKRDRAAPKFRAFSKQFKQELANLYQNATKGRKQSTDFPGADIWRYVNEYLPHDLQPGARNMLIVLTDGYLDFENHKSPLHKKNRHNNSHFLAELRGQPKWRERFTQDNYGIVVRDKLKTLHAGLILELHPKNEWAEELPMLQHMWRDWLNRLGVQSVDSYGRLALPTLREQLNRHLQLDTIS